MTDRTRRTLRRHCGHHRRGHRCRRLHPRHCPGNRPRAPRTVRPGATRRSWPGCDELECKFTATLTKEQAQMWREMSDLGTDQTCCRAGALCCRAREHIPGPACVAIEIVAFDHGDVITGPCCEVRGTLPRPPHGAAWASLAFWTRSARWPSFASGAERWPWSLVHGRWGSGEAVSQAPVRPDACPVPPHSTRWDRTRVQYRAFLRSGSERLAHSVQRSPARC